jgi:threonine dehydrogenase-like Zn-dependent dehydrogenase
MGAERIIVMSRHEDRQKLALEFGATDIVTERGDEGVARIKDLTNGLGAHSVIEAVGTQEAMMQSIRATRPGGHVGFVGVLHDVKIPGEEFFFSHVHLHGGPAPVRYFLPELIDLIWSRKINPGKVFDLTLPLEQVAEGYRAMDERARLAPLPCQGPRSDHGGNGRRDKNRFRSRGVSFVLHVDHPPRASREMDGR